MIVCKRCGVELERAMVNCPLCGQAVSDEAVTDHPVGVAGKDAAVSPAGSRRSGGRVAGPEMSHPQKKFTWEIVSLILLSGSVATFIIDFILNTAITWSEYPLAVSLTVFAYISLFAFWRQPTWLQLTGGVVLSSCFLVCLDLLTGGISWSIQLGIPLLLAASLIAALLTNIVRRSKHKGINLLAWAFLGAALLCLCVEGILTHFGTGRFRFEWSIIAGGCVIPVVLTLFFVHFRLKKGRNLERTFHI